MKNERLELMNRVLQQDQVETDAQPPREENFLANTAGSLLRAAVLGYKATLRVLPDESVTKNVDYTHLGTKGSLGWNVPPWVEENRGKVVKNTFHYERRGKVKPKTT